MADSKQWSKQMAALDNSLKDLFNRSITAGLLRGIQVAVRETVQDSGQAAVHWMLAGADGRSSRPWQRTLGKLTYLRGSPSRAPVAPVGYRGQGGGNSKQLESFVRARELEEVLSKLVSGRRPEFRFYLYNAVGDVQNYATNANIDEAGNRAIEEVVKYAEDQFNAANTRRVPLK